MTIIKRAFGVIAVLTGVGMLIVGLGHPFFPDSDLEIGMLFGGGVLGSLFVMAGWRWMLNEVDLDVVNVDIHDPRVLEASQRAKETLSTLWRYLEEGRHECYVKFPLQMRSGNLEHVWGVVHSRTADTVLVSVVNMPVEKPLERDGRMNVAINGIEDWQVIVGPDEIRGGYSVGALAEIVRSRGMRLGRKSRETLRAFRDLRPQL